MNVGWPEGIYLALVLVSIGICVARFGEQKRDRYDLTDVLVGPAISLSLLWWGGFFA
jgi:hypothetical protein